MLPAPAGPRARADVPAAAGGPGSALLKDATAAHHALLICFYVLIARILLVCDAQARPSTHLFTRESLEAVYRKLLSWETARASTPATCCTIVEATHISIL
jgi:hypothetical protein